MPTVPDNTKCNFLGCRAARVFGTNSCELHGAKRSDKYTHNAKLYNSTVWKRIKASAQSQHPICQSCILQGRVAQTETIDHVFPHRQDERRFVVNLYQGLCIPCHTQKTKLENRGIYRHYTTEGVKDYVETDYAFAVTSNYSERLD